MSKLRSDCPNGFQARKYTNTKSRLNTKPIAMSLSGPPFGLFLFLWSTAWGRKICFQSRFISRPPSKSEMRKKVEIKDFQVCNHTPRILFSCSSINESISTKAILYLTKKYSTHHVNWWRLIIITQWADKSKRIPKLNNESIIWPKNHNFGNSHPHSWKKMSCAQFSLYRNLDIRWTNSNEYQNHNPVESVVVFFFICRNLTQLLLYIWILYDAMNRGYSNANVKKCVHRQKMSTFHHLHNETGKQRKQKNTRFLYRDSFQNLNNVFARNPFDTFETGQVSFLLLPFWSKQVLHTDLAVIENDLVINAVIRSQSYVRASISISSNFHSIFQQFNGVENKKLKQSVRRICLHINYPEIVRCNFLGHPHLISDEEKVKGKPNATSTHKQ